MANAQAGVNRFICLGPYCWGEGATPGAAKRNAKRHVPSFIQSPEFNIWQVGPGAEVTGHGDISYPVNEMKPRLIAKANGGVKRQR